MKEYDVYCTRGNELMDSKEERDKKDIILVDDEDVVLDSTLRILKSEGYSLDGVSTAEDAIELLDEKSYRMMITDLMMPGISGFQLLEKVRDKFPLMPIIIITGYATLNNIMDSFNRGAFDFIPKPFSFDELLSVVGRGLNYVSQSHEFSSREEYLKSFSSDENLENYYFLGDHSWVKFSDDGSARVGVGISFSHTMGSIKEFDMPDSKQEIAQGNAFSSIISENSIEHRVLSPVSGRIIENNPELLKDHDLINRDPFVNGWLTRIIPQDREREVVYLKYKTDKSHI
jgi:FixJ family two-component response regulator/glycine cleavage system H lipoate-binding protein